MYFGILGRMGLLLGIVIKLATGVSLLRRELFLLIFSNSVQSTVFLTEFVAMVGQFKGLYPIHTYDGSAPSDWSMT
jgi:hypothetical protein